MISAHWLLRQSDQDAIANDGTKEGYKLHIWCGAYPPIEEHQSTKRRRWLYSSPRRVNFIAPNPPGWAFSCLFGCVVFSFSAASLTHNELVRCAFTHVFAIWVGNTLLWAGTELVSCWRTLQLAHSLNGCAICMMTCLVRICLLFMSNRPTHSYPYRDIPKCWDFQHLHRPVRHVYTCTCVYRMRAYKSSIVAIFAKIDDEKEERIETHSLSSSI